jgi:hypothetical protein
LVIAIGDCLPIVDWAIRPNPSANPAIQQSAIRNPQSAISIRNLNPQSQPTISIHNLNPQSPIANPDPQSAVRNPQSNGC